MSRGVRLASTRKDWVLTGDALSRLLNYLDPNQDLAAEEYERLRQMLIVFFQYRGLTNPDQLADDTINRVARRLSEGEQIDASPRTYFYAVARNVWREQLVSPRVPASVDDLPPSVLAMDSIAESTHIEREQRFECLERCLAQLPPDTRELILNYYHGEKSSKIQTRKELAAQLGIQPNALRIRVCRIRDKLEQCVRNCLDEYANH